MTPSDFVCVERSRENRPKRGGGQTYFSLGARLTGEDFGRFLGFDPPSLVVSEHSPVTVEAAVLDEPSRREALKFGPRYRNESDRRYCIARQNRQREDQVRHPAWTAERGFPIAPDDIAESTDPRMPDLSQLKLIVARCDDGRYFADYVNADQPPDRTPERLAVLFKPNRRAGADGLIELEQGELSQRRLRNIVAGARERPRQGRLTSPEIEDARDATARAAGRRGRRGQGFRQSSEEREAIDLHAMAKASAWLEARRWHVIDRSANHSYDLFCTRGRKKLHVEVKGTTSDGSAVLLTPNEVALARSVFPAMALLVVHGVQLSAGKNGKPVASGGEIDFVCPWEIDADGSLQPTGYSYERAESGG